MNTSALWIRPRCIVKFWTEPGRFGSGMKCSKPAEIESMREAGIRAPGKGDRSADMGSMMEA